MTTREYILEELKAFEVSDAQLLDMSLSGGYGLEDEYDASTMKAVGVSMAGMIEKLVFSPKVSNITESGFSVSWNYADLGKYYLWLCRKWGISPNDDVLGMLGVSMITDKTDSW